MRKSKTPLIKFIIITIFCALFLGYCYYLIRADGFSRDSGFSVIMIFPISGALLGIWARALRGLAFGADVKHKRPRVSFFPSLERFSFWLVGSLLLLGGQMLGRETYSRFHWIIPLCFFAWAFSLFYVFFSGSAALELARTKPYKRWADRHIKK